MQITTNIFFSHQIYQKEILSDIIVCGKNTWKRATFKFSKIEKYFLNKWAESIKF